jgi:hypothetical protein
MNTPQGLSDNTGASTRPTQGSFAAYLNDPRFTIPSVTNVLLSNDVPYQIPWGLVRADSKPGCPRTDLLNITLTAHMKPFQPDDLALELILSPPRQLALTESAMQLPIQCRTQTTVTMKDQQTIVLDGFTEARSGKEQSILIVTPYIIWNDADLRTLYECKVKLAQAARAGN